MNKEDAGYLLIALWIGCITVRIIGIYFMNPILMIADFPLTIKVIDSILIFGLPFFARIV